MKKTKLASSQSRKFIKAASEAECSDDEAVFDATLKKIGSHKPGVPMAKELKTAEELKALLDERIARYSLGHKKSNPQWIKIDSADPAKEGANWKVAHSGPTGAFADAIERVTPELQKLYDLLPEKP